MSDSSDDGPSCGVGYSANIGTQCCHVSLCDSEYCETCIDCGNGSICSKCKLFTCCDCDSDDDYNGCKCVTTSSSHP